MAQQLLVLGCDVTAPPDLAKEDHVERLIWGRFPGAGPGLGIGAMMDIADGFGVKMTFFLDEAETGQAGVSISRARQKILDRGHDLQLLPDSQVLGKLPDFNFEDFDSAEAMHQYLRRYWAQDGECEIACLQFRSWSLLHKDKEGAVVYKGQERANRLREFFRYMPREVQVVTAKELHGRLQSEEIKPKTDRGADHS